jgi:hypothetical protein
MTEGTDLVPELDLARIRRYCAERIPAHIAHLVRLEVNADGRSVTILECRPPWSPDMGPASVEQLRPRLHTPRPSSCTAGVHETAPSVSLTSRAGCPRRKPPLRTRLASTADKSNSKSPRGDHRRARNSPGVTPRSARSPLVHSDIAVQIRESMFDGHDQAIVWRPGSAAVRPAE